MKDHSAQEKALADIKEINGKLDGLYKVPLQESFDTLMGCFCTLLGSHYKLLQRVEELENK